MACLPILCLESIYISITLGIFIKPCLPFAFWIRTEYTVPHLFEIGKIDGQRWFFSTVPTERMIL